MSDRPPTASQNDGHLISAVARGDESAVELFYRTHCDAVLRFVYRRASGSFEDAQEITQDTFLSALKMAPTYRGDSSAYVWLCGIARVRIVDFFRKQNREKRVPPGMTLSLDAALENAIATPETFDASGAVDLVMSILSEDEREAMMLRYVDELPVRDVARLLGRTEKAIENLLLRAKQKQRAAITRGALKGAANP